MNALDVDLGGQAWRLLAGRALLHLATRTLVVADVHLGKAATFRARGVPVPQGTTTGNLQRLSGLLAAQRARAVVFLGDLFHAREAHAQDTLERVAAWRESHAGVDLTLVEGNHDRSAGAPPQALGVRVVDEPWPFGGAILCHHPRPVEGGSVIAGHLHPCVRLHGRADASVRLPCFWLRAGQWVLPAFGDFTGGARIERGRGDRVIAVADDRLFEIPAARSLAV